MTSSLNSIHAVTIASLLVSSATAMEVYVSEVPNGALFGLDGMDLGHIDGETANRNEFGEGLRAMIDKEGPSGPWADLCELDSDSDGFTNGEELGDPCCTWVKDGEDPQITELSLLSNPGNPDETAAEKPVCEAPVPDGTAPVPDTNGTASVPDTDGTAEGAKPEDIKCTLLPKVITNKDDVTTEISNDDDGYGAYEARN